MSRRATVAILAATATALAAALASASAGAAPEDPSLEARAILPADASAPAPFPGSPSTDPAPAPVATQPVGGFSALVRAGEDAFWAMPDSPAPGGTFDADLTHGATRSRPTELRSSLRERGSAGAT